MKALGFRDPSVMVHEQRTLSKIDDGKCREAVHLLQVISIKNHHETVQRLIALPPGRFGMLQACLIHRVPRGLLHAARNGSPKSLSKLILTLVTPRVQEPGLKTIL